ncbi:MAG: hypothetical protein FWD73_07100 [Polyangiaceae bacterium]|nr:hypothetical protein [Polyangiaceae bacterium]
MAALSDAASDHDPVVLMTRKVRDDVKLFFEDVDLMVLAIDTLRDRVVAFRKFRDVFSMLGPALEAKIEDGIRGLDAIDRIRLRVEDFRESKVMEALDQAVETSVNAVATRALARAYAGAEALGRRPTVEEAMKSLDDIGDFIRKHHLKFASG